MFKINIHNAFFGIILFLLISISVFEIHYLLLLGTFLIYYAKVSKKVIDVISFLILIVIIGVGSSFFNEVKLYDWIKDFTYLSKPIIGVLAGFLISKKINNLKYIIRIIISISLLFAIYHIILILFKVDFSASSVSDIRRIGGISNEIETLAIIFLVASWKIKEINVIKNPLYKKIILAILIASFSLYFSRTMIISLAILLLASFGYLRITSTGIKYASLALLFFGLFYVYLFNADIKRNQSGFESFLYKMKIAPAEIFSPPKITEKNNHAVLWDRWRAYEAHMAINQIDTYRSFLLGKGLGSLVDLKFAAPIGEKNLRYIPILHNGYINIFFKSGILGVIIYILLLLILYLKVNIKTQNLQTRFIYNLIGGLSIHYLFTTLIVTGMYNLSEFYVFILGVLLYHSKEKEN